MAGTSVSWTVLKSMIFYPWPAISLYTLSTKSFVSLAEEICFVHNYDLNNYRYPDSLTYQIDIRDLCDNAAVFLV